MTVTPRVNILVHLAATWAAIAFSQSGCKNSNTIQYVAELKHVMPFTSPNYPLPYDNNADCLWTIETKPSYTSDYIVKVTFVEFELEGHSAGSCRYDILKFYSGLPLESHLLGSYCSRARPDVIYSTGRKLYVNFQTDSTTVYKGFKFYYTAVKKEEANGICRSPYDGVESRLTGSSGTFFSPNYPAPYPTKATCIWQITVPEGKVVKLTFKNFDYVKMHLSACLEIRDSLISTGKEIGSHNCRSDELNLTKSVYSSGRYMFVKFQSHSYVGWIEEGFKASFEAVGAGEPTSTFVSSTESCYPGNALNNDLRLSGAVGTFKSPPKYPSRGLSCTWVISVPEEKVVKLFFTKFDLNWRAGECGDHVEVFDGQYISSKILKKYCAYQDPTTEDKGVRSSGRYMTVRFKSDYRLLYFEAPNEDEGFEAQFEAVKQSDSTVVIIGVVVGVVVLIIVGLCVGCNSKRKRTLDRETRAERIPVTTRTSASHRTQPSAPPPLPPPEATAVNPFPAPEVGYSPVPIAPPPAYPYPLESPPPYPGGEETPQYPPPGESYPWLQSNVSAESPTSTTSP